MLILTALAVVLSLTRIYYLQFSIPLSLSNAAYLLCGLVGIDVVSTLCYLIFRRRNITGRQMMIASAVMLVIQVVVLQCYMVQSSWNAAFVDNGAIYLNDANLPNKMINYYEAFPNNAFMGVVFYGVYQIADWIGSNGHVLLVSIICFLAQVPPI